MMIFFQKRSPTPARMNDYWLGVNSIVNIFKVHIPQERIES